MIPDLLKRIFAETGPDFSAEICPKATMADLDTRAIDNSAGDGEKIGKPRVGESFGGTSFLRMPS